MTRRALFVGGPFDGRTEADHVAPPSGAIAAPRWHGADRWLAGTDPEIPEEATVELVTYRATKLVDLDGTDVLVYALPDELVAAPRRGREPRGERPDLTVWDLARERDRLRRELDEAERTALEEEDRARRALRLADGMASELRALRDALTIERHQSSSDG